LVPPALPRRALHLAVILDPTLPADEVATTEALADALATALRTGDIVSVRSMALGATPTLDGDAMLPDTAGAIHLAFDSVFAQGGTPDLDDALAWAYGAVGAPATSEVRRVWVVGGLTEKFTAQRVHQMRDDAAGTEGIRVGLLQTSNTPSPQADLVTRAALGPSILLDGPDEARRVAARLDSLVEIGAEDLTEVDLNLPAGFSIDQELLPPDGAPASEEHPIPALRPLVRQLRATTCAPDLAGPDAVVTMTAHWRGLLVDPGGPESSSMVQTTLGALLSSDPTAVTKGRAFLDYARWAGAPEDAGLRAAVLASLAEADALLPGDLDLLEIRTVVDGFPVTTGGSGTPTVETGGSGAATTPTSGTASGGTGAAN
jgi:hypothetical protein